MKGFLTLMVCAIDVAEHWLITTLTMRAYRISLPTGINKRRTFMDDKWIKQYELPAHNEATKDNITVEGITADYVWYHSELLKQKMQTWQTEFERVMKVMSARHGEHLVIIGELIRQNAALKEKLKEKNNG
jgi:hypothetical protein